jgi:hypothetical protein
LLRRRRLGRPWRHPGADQTGHGMFVGVEKVDDSRACVMRLD